MSSSGRPLTTSHAGSSTMHRNGNDVTSGTSTAAMKRLNQPSRVVASIMPSVALATATAGGTAGTHALTSRPSDTLMNTAGNIRPPRNPQLADTSSAASLTATITRRVTAL